MDPSNHGSCRLWEDDDPAIDLTSSRSQLWMSDFCGHLLRQPWLHPSAQQTQSCAVDLLRQFVAIPCETQRNQSLNPFLDAGSPAGSQSGNPAGNPGNPSVIKCCGIEDYPLSSQTFSSCFMEFLKIFSPKEREYFVGIPYFKVAFGRTGIACSFIKL